MEVLASLNRIIVEMTSTSQLANFAVRFCNELDKLDNKNDFICSPLSVETLLALVALGSSNDTRAELLTALDLPDDHTIQSTFSSLTKNLDLGSFSFSHALSFFTSKLFNKRDAILKIANKIYVKKEAALKSNLKHDAVKVFKSNLEQIDFSKSSAAADTINNWVANQTNNIITKIVSPDQFNKDTGLVLVNAIYFHGFWEIPFKSEDTFTGEFHVDHTTNVKIRMMKMEGRSFNYKHSPELKAKILQMFYKGGEASMVIILPDEPEGLSSVMRELSTGHDLMTTINCLEKTKLGKIIIPKFKIETEINLKNLLPEMGIKTIFDEDKADINMLSSNEKLYVSEAIQKAYILVDEKGTEAAAATSFTMINACAMLWMGESFIADHPYLYLLTAREIPIFYGIFRGNDSYSKLEIEEIDRQFREINDICNEAIAKLKSKVGM